MVVLGLRWGEERQHILSPALRDLRDTRKGKEHLPHPLLLAGTKLLPITKQSLGEKDMDWCHIGDWYPLSMEKLTQPLQSISQNELKSIITAHNVYYDDEITPSDINSACRILSLENSSSHRTFYIHVGDDVEVTYDNHNVPAWCTIKCMFGVVIGQKGYLYLWLEPAWYDHPKGQSGRGRKPKEHKTRLTTVLQRTVPDKDRHPML